METQGIALSPSGHPELWDRPYSMLNVRCIWAYGQMRFCHTGAEVTEKTNATPVTSSFSLYMKMYYL